MELGDGMKLSAGFMEGIEFNGLNDDVLKLAGTVAQTLHGGVELDVVCTIVGGAQHDNSVAPLLKDLMVLLDVFEELRVFAVAVLENSVALVSKVGGFDVPVFGFVFEGGLFDVGGEVGSELAR